MCSSFRLLYGKGDGTFLIRDSTNFPGDFTLSMSYRGKVASHSDLCYH